MKIFVRAKPNSGQAKVEKIDNAHFIVAVREPAQEGKANVAVMEALADYFQIGISKVTLLKGFSSKEKIFEIESL